MEKILFHPENYDLTACMSFKSKEECVAFSKYLDSIGKRWRSGERYTEQNYYNGNPDVVYLFNQGTFSHERDALRSGYTVLNYGDFYYNSEDAPPPSISLTFEQLFGNP